ncbi:MAG: hypothetical protein HY886_06095 [Deltaproteobacteria bacterium]|nr:hypothetical protein [Deltaproteobacteria bacterium]
MTNLDLLCASAGYEMASAGDDAITKSLGVLQEDGVYAFFLYCKAKNGYDKVVEAAVNLLKKDGICLDVGATPGYFNDSLDKLLLAKDLLEQALIYGRYHAKAKENNTTPAVPAPVDEGVPPAGATTPGRAG